MNGDKIDPIKEYRISIPDFFLDGGDDFKQIRTWYSPKDLQTGGDIREAIKTFAKEKKILNSKEDPILKPEDRFFEIKNLDKPALFL